MGVISEVIAGAIKPVTNLLSKREERKQAATEVRHATQQVKLGNEAQVNLSRAQWEHVSKTLEGDTWKDEFATVVIFAPFILLMLGCIFAAFGHGEVLQASKEFLAELEPALESTYGDILKIVVGAAVGIKIFKKL